MELWLRIQERQAQVQTQIDAKVVRLREEQRQVIAVAEQVRAKRRELGMTQADLAQRVGSTQPSVARFESGKLPGVGYGFVKRLLDALGSG